MEYSDTTIHNIDLLTEVLNAVGAKGVFENPDFLIDNASSGYYRMIAKVVSGNRRTVPITLYIEGDGIRLDVCGLDESFEWTNDEIFSSRKRIGDFFTNLFTSYVLIEACGTMNSKSRMYFFDKDGTFVEKYVIRGLFQSYSGWSCDKSLFFPLY